MNEQPIYFNTHYKFRIGTNHICNVEVMEIRDTEGTQNTVYVCHRLDNGVQVLAYERDLTPLHL